MALSDGYRSVNWQDLRDRSVALAEIMQSELSLIADQHIALLVGNRVEFIELMLAGMIAGVWITPVNTHLQADEVSYIVKDSEAKVVFFDTAHEHLLADHGQRADLTSNSHRYINIESLAEKITQRLANAKVTDLYACFPLSGPAGGTMLYTSGTTGKPKGVKRNKPNSLGEALDRMQSGGALFGLVGTGPHIVTGPLYHAAPMLFALYDLLNGAPMVIMPKWDNLAFIQLVAQHKATTTHLVPTMCVRLLNALAEDPEQYAAHDISSLTLALHGAAPIAKTTKQKMLDWWGPILVEYWGGTEAGVTTIVTSEQWLSHSGTVGKALSHFDVFVGDKQGNEILSESDKTEGLLFCRHHQLSQVFEYHHDHSKTLKAHPQPYVFCIGDIGYVDDEGFVYLSDRESNMIISGGVNIYPAETEQILLEHEAVADVAVFGVPSEEWGEVVKAAVQLKPGYDDTSELEQQMIAWVREKIAIYKAPRSIVFEASLPRTPTGKLLVRKLKEKY
ncbi:hypothetical protein A9Q99_24050 [Gammaproteobacteria bacterium 45_16_T64]|nr:hypothetical protein A9Q99_24050 [Gammaproteobacteria bacterium 45_16_T64]